MKKKTGPARPGSKKQQPTNREPGAPLTFVEPPVQKPADMSIGDYIKSVLSITDRTGVSFGDRILRKQAALAAQGNSKAAEFLFDRAYGKPAQTVNVQEMKPQVVIEHQVISIEEAKQGNT